MKTFTYLLIELNACYDALNWAGDKPIEEVVKTCHRGDWLLWLAQKVDIGLKPLTLAKGHCANTVRHLMDNEPSLKAVDTAIAFGEGKVTRDELDDAATDAVYDAAASWAAAAAARKDAWAAASWAADAAFFAANDDPDDAKAKNRMKTADICRKYIGDLIIEKVNEQLKTTEQ